MIRIMLIDDEEDALDLLSILLERMEGVEVVARYLDPLQAMEELDDLVVDAVFLDIQMPGMLGMEVAKLLRQDRPNLPIVFTTAYAEYAVEAFEIQSTDYLLKPFRPDRLTDAVERIRVALSIYERQVEEQVAKPYVVQCLGGFHIEANSGQTGGIAWRTKKERELCAYLIHQSGRSVGTAEIVEALWSTHDLNKAKAYLYTCLSYLRKTLSQHQVPIVIEKIGQGFVAQMANHVCDVVVFSRLLDDILSKERISPQSYSRMNQLYQGDYLENCDYNWAIAQQMRIKISYIQVLRMTHSHFRSQGNDTLAVDSLHRILTLAPDSEYEGRTLMQLYLEAGNRAEAIRIGRQLEEAVRTQLGAELEEETSALIKQLEGKLRRHDT